MDDVVAEQAVAAVAVIEVGRKLDCSVLVLQRVVHPEDPWSGQLAFPGGRKEVSDENLFATCLRETREECGIELQASELVKPLPASYAGRVANRLTLVQPYYFRREIAPKIELQQTEMRAYFWLPLQYFLDVDQHETSEIAAGRIFPCIRVEGWPLWGFTYEVLRSLYLP